MSGRRSLSARELAARVLSRVLDEGAWVAPALDAELVRHGGKMSAADRGLATELVYGTLRWLVPLEKSLLRGAKRPGRGLDDRIRPHLLIAAYQLQHLHQRIPAHAAVNEAVSSIRKARPGLAGFSNALLRKLDPSPLGFIDEDAALRDYGEALGIPPVLVRAAGKNAGGEEDGKNALRAFLERPALGIRWLGPKAEEAGFRAAMTEMGRGFRRHEFVEQAYLIEGGGQVRDLPGFASGLIQVQDPASQLVALLANARSGDRVLDLAAAPGGKSMILSRCVGSAGSVRAVEVDPRRAERLTQNVRRMGASNIDVRVEDGRIVPAGEAPFDVVLLDAPCSGLGTLRRRPDIKLRRSEADVSARVTLQRELLDAAACRVAVGGTLVYAVCSPVPAEGAEVVSAFLEAHPAYIRRRAGDILSGLPDSAMDENGDLLLQTHLHECDSFFACHMTRATD